MQLDLKYYATLYEKNIRINNIRVGGVKNQPKQFSKKEFLRKTLKNVEKMILLLS